MNFNSLNFLVLFLPATVFAFYAVPMRFRLLILASSSLCFYGAAGFAVLLAFVIAILWSYATAFLFGKWPKGLAIIFAISVPAFFLIMFKYLNFMLDTFGAGLQTREHFSFFFSVLLPAGISFYTFELICYSIDVADSKIEPERNLLGFVAFATFFPHLIAGPIMRYAQLRDQLQAVRSNPVLAPQFVSGVKLLAFGLFFKIFIADISGIAAAKASSARLEDLTAIDQLAAIGFWSMQIYYDFWAYSVMAIGLGRLFCIELPVNFREPYLSPNPREFWRRWHVTLSYWLRDYVYLRMGGREVYVRNILIVFALVGLWHGAGWNFVAWGVYHGLLVILYHYTSPFWDRLPQPVAIALTFVLVSLGWPLFFMDLERYAAFLQHLAVAPWNIGSYRALHIALLAAFAGITFGLREKNWLYTDRPSGVYRVVNSAVLVGGLMFAGLLFVSFSRTFIYFRF